MNEFDESCSNWKTDVRSLGDIKFCSLGSQIPHKIMFWGDSHVEQMYPVIEQLYNNGELAEPRRDYGDREWMPAG